MSSLNRRRIGRVVSFSIATVIYMAMSLAIPGLWSPTVSRATDGFERIFFFACGIWSAGKLDPQPVCNDVEPQDVE